MGVYVGICKINIDKANRVQKFHIWRKKLYEDK
jgi:hypothetical protein